MSYLNRGLNRISHNLLSLFAILGFALLAMNAQAQTPDSVDGKTLVVTIASGSGGRPTSGKLAIVLSDSGNTFHNYGLTANISNESGTFTYVKNSATNAILTLTEGTNNLSVNVKFTSAAGGTFRLTVVGGAGVQSGTFQLFNGPSPVDPSNRVYDLTATSGVSPFTAAGHFRMFLHGDGTYLLKNVATLQSSTGTYTNESSNGSTVLLTLSNSGFGNGYAFLAFSNSVLGIYLFDNGTGFQVGKFHEVLPPTITQSPGDTGIVLNKPVSLSVHATGDAPLRYQWFFNANPIANATNATFSISSVKLTNGGSFYVAVANDGGTTNSALFNLTIILPPVFVTQPVGVTNPVGSTILLTSLAAGTDPLHYQWQFNGHNLAGKTDSSLTITNAKLSNSGSYRVLVKNTAGSAVSRAAGVKILTPIQITSGPRGYLADTNAKVLLNVTATGSAPIVYQWALNGTNIAGATKAQYVVNGVSITNQGLYTVVVSNAVSSTNLAAYVFPTVAPYDPNHDGQTDLLLQTDDGHLLTWFLSGPNFLKYTWLNTNKVIDPAWRVAGLSDFNNDGQKDILLQNTNSGALMVKYMQRTNFIGTTTFDPTNGIDASWRVSSVADFDGNGSGDILAQNTTNDTVAVWLMNGTNFLNTTPIVLYSYDERGIAGFSPIASTNWLGVRQHLIGVGNFHPLGYEPSPDILTQETNGVLRVWVMTGTNFTYFSDGTNLFSTNCIGFATFLANGPDGQFAITPDRGGTHFEAVAIADFTYDGESDVVFQSAAGYLGVWFMNGNAFLSASGLHGNKPINHTWKIVGPK